MGTITTGDDRTNGKPGRTMAMVIANKMTDLEETILIWLREVFYSFSDTIKQGEHKQHLDDNTSHRLLIAHHVHLHHQPEGTLLIWA